MVDRAKPFHKTFDFKYFTSSRIPFIFWTSAANFPLDCLCNQKLTFDCICYWVIKSCIYQNKLPSTTRYYWLILRTTMLSSKLHQCQQVWYRHSWNHQKINSRPQRTLISICSRSIRRINYQTKGQSWERGVYNWGTETRVVNWKFCISASGGICLLH